MIWHDRPSQNEIASGQRPNTKGPSRLEESKAEAKLTVVTDKQFKQIVRTRDRMRCRKCGCKTLLTMEHRQGRCEVHHLHGRLGVFRHEDRCALVLCLFCHQQVTGKVAERYIVKGTKFLTIQTKQGPQTCIDARQPVTFERIA